MYKGITPTFTLNLTDETINLNNATNVYVTFADRKGNELITKETDELAIDGHTVDVYLTQEETLSFPTGTVNIQLNWTYAEDGELKRSCSDIVTAFFEKNLQNKVLQ